MHIMTGLLGAAVGVAVAAVIWAVVVSLRKKRSGDAPELDERPVTLIVAFAFVAALNLGVAIARIADGEPLLENGLLTRESSMNLVLGAGFVPVTAASIASAVRARREDA